MDGRAVHPPCQLGAHQLVETITRIEARRALELVRLELTLRLLPPPVVDMWETSGKTAFDQFIAQVHGTP